MEKTGTLDKPETINLTRVNLDGPEDLKVQAAFSMLEAGSRLLTQNFFV